MSEQCPFKYSNDIQCIKGKRYRHVEEMPEKLLDNDLPEFNLIYLGECYKCAKVTVDGKSAWRYEIDKNSCYWSG